MGGPVDRKTEMSPIDRLDPLPLPHGSMFPRTRYFEIDSSKAGVRYAVWITTPKTYDQNPDQCFPAIYMPDGNWNASFSAELCDLYEWDLIDAFQPTIQICVGYTGDEIDLAISVRPRDLLPPDEPYPPETEEGVMADIEAGLLDQRSADLYVHHLKNPAADRFLAFLTEELHPLVAAHYRIQPDTLGLFGHSYGGLFAAYAALQKTSIFRNICASSPGILPQQSAVFKRYADALAEDGIDARNLHMTLGTREISVPGIYPALVGRGTVEFIALAGAQPLGGLNFTSQFFEGESHMTIKAPAMHSFLRTFYRRTA
jgi:predicted alpha/beta superfamily hydrolase